MKSPCKGPFDELFGPRLILFFYLCFKELIFLTETKEKSFFLSKYKFFETYILIQFFKNNLIKHVFILSDFLLK